MAPHWNLKVKVRLFLLVQGNGDSIRRDRYDGGGKREKEREMRRKRNRERGEGGCKRKAQIG